MNFEKTILGLGGSLSSGFVLAHGASFDHTHSMLESPAVVLCVLVCVGVVVAISRSLKPTACTGSVEANQRPD